MAEAAVFSIADLGKWVITDVDWHADVPFVDLVRPGKMLIR